MSVLTINFINRLKSEQNHKVVEVFSNFKPTKKKVLVRKKSTEYDSISANKVECRKCALLDFVTTYKLPLFTSIHPYDYVNCVIEIKDSV